MKIHVILGVMLLSMMVVEACDNSVVSGKVENFNDEMMIKFYCDGEYWGYKNIISKYGTYYKTLDYCAGSITGELYLGDVLLDVKTADKLECDFWLEFQGIEQVPEFTTVGAAVALIGSIMIYKRKKYK